MDIHPIAPDKRDAVLAALASIERTHDVRILFACESGSRGWGFSSPDSDYDARFVYAHRPAWYLTVNERARPGQPQRDVIELPIDGELDVSGWDIRKALRLLEKSNPTLLEWLRSPVVYRHEPTWAAELRDLADRCHSRMAAWHHYYSMASTTFRDHLLGERIRTKKYLYALRPLLCCQWIEQDSAPPPMAFEDLLDRLLPQGALRESVDALLTVKRASKEVEDRPRDPVISNFIESTLARMATESPRLPGSNVDDAELDDYLRRLIGFPADR